VTAVTLGRAGAVVEARLPPCIWFTGLRIVPVHGAQDVTTGDEEACVLLLAGTFDLAAGGTHWGNRGARASPLVGRPSAVFLPPRTTLRAGNGDGELLVVSARRPPAPAAVGRAVLAQSPLLPLAGSGKAFDPRSGEWLTAEAFPSSAELLPPRRMPRAAVGPVTVEHVFPADYKAATLTIAEAVLPAGTTLRLASLLEPGAGREMLVFVRGEAHLQAPGDDQAVAGEGAACFATPLGIAGAEIHVGNEPCYLVIALAGKGGT
jgi:hypothetical protein